MDVEHISVGGIVYDISDKTLRAKPATKDSLGLVMLSDSSEITEPTTLALPATEKNPLVEQSLAWQIGEMRKERDDLYKTNAAGMHNMKPRCKNLTNIYSIEEICRRISDGSFDDIYVGDYLEFDETNRWRFGHFDYWLNSGNADKDKCVKHHAVVVPDAGIDFCKMNETAVSNYGYMATDLYKNKMPGVRDQIREIFGTEHILQYQDMFFNEDIGYYTWYDVTIELMSEIMVYGGFVYCPAGYYGTDLYGIGENRCTVSKSQLALFSACPWLMSQRQYCWLRDSATRQTFCAIGGGGLPVHIKANLECYVRPVFGLC